MKTPQLGPESVTISSQLDSFTALLLLLSYWQLVKTDSAGKFPKLKKYWTSIA